MDKQKREKDETKFKTGNGAPGEAAARKAHLPETPPAENGSGSEPPVPGPAEEEHRQEPAEQQAVEEAAGQAEKPEAEQKEEETLSELERERLAWQREKEELIDRLQRKQADLDNFRRISRNEQEEVRTYGLFEFAGKLLPVLDNLERALQAAGDENVPSSHREGLEMIYKQLLQLLEQEGVSAIEALGRPFDPHYHHAVMQTGEGEAEPGTVVEEFQRGYMFKKRVLRPAMVKVFQAR